MPQLGADPFLKRLRDAQGVARVALLVAATYDERKALEKAVGAIDGVASVSTSRRREKELPTELRRARSALRDAVAAASHPGTAEILRGALARMPRLRQSY